MERQIRVHRNSRRASDSLRRLVRMVSLAVRYAVDPRLRSCGFGVHLAGILAYRAVRGNLAVGKIVTSFISSGVEGVKS